MGKIRGFGELYLPNDKYPLCSDINWLCDSGSNFIFVILSLLICNTRNLDHTSNFQLLFFKELISFIQ